MKNLKSFLGNNVNKNISGYACFAYETKSIIKMMIDLLQMFINCLEFFCIQRYPIIVNEYVSDLQKLPPIECLEFSKRVDSSGLRGAPSLCSISFIF